MYLDADMLVLRSIDCLFELPPGFYAGVLCCAALCCAMLRGLVAITEPCPKGVAWVESQMHDGLLRDVHTPRLTASFALPATAPDCAAGRETQAERDACSLLCAEQPPYFNAGVCLLCCAKLSHEKRSVKEGGSVGKSFAGMTRALASCLLNDGPFPPPHSSCQACL